MNTKASTMIATFFIVLSLGLFSVPELQADPCADYAFGLPTGPVTVGFLEGDLGTAHRVCGRNEAGLKAAAVLVVEPDNFYGRLGAGISLQGSWAFNSRGELFGGLEAFRYEQVLAPIGSNSAGLGNLHVGAAYRFLNRDKISLGINGKLVLPTAYPLYQNTRPFGLDIGIAGQFAVSHKVHFHAQIGLLGSVGAGKGPALPRGGITAGGGIELKPGPKFAFVLDLQSMFLYQAPLENLSAAMALRFSDAKRFGFDIGFDIPIVGRERALAAVDFLATIRLGPMGTPE